MAEDDKGKYKLKKLIKMLSKIKGRHTELVTVYVPSGYSLNEISNQLRQEQGTADNIKSKAVRKNVTTALDKIVRHLQLYKKTPENGLALFCGNVSTTDKVDMEIWAIEPPDPVKVKLYWCDQRFVLDPLLEMLKEKDVYGIICLDKSEANVAILTGKKIESKAHFESIVPGKARAGGQSAARFSRVREGLLNDFLKQVGEAVNKVFQEYKVKGIILSGPGPIKEMFIKEDHVHADIKKNIIGTIDTSYTGEHGLHETIERGEDLLKEADVVREKQILQRFFTELQKPHGLVAYGLNEVLDALKKGAVETLIVSENIDTVTGKEDFIEELEEEVKNYGSNLEVVSSDTREGLQFEELGGIGAILRYNI